MIFSELSFRDVHTLAPYIEENRYVRQPITFTFTMTVQAIGTVVADLTALAISGTEFEIAVSEKQGTDWTFKAIKVNPSFKPDTFAKK